MPEAEPIFPFVYFVSFVVENGFLVKNCRTLFSQPLQRGLIQLDHNFCVVFNASDDRLARTLPPLITAIKGILALIALGKAVEAAYKVV